MGMLTDANTKKRNSVADLVLRILVAEYALEQLHIEKTLAQKDRRIGPTDKADYYKLRYGGEKAFMLDEEAWRDW